MTAEMAGPRQQIGAAANRAAKLTRGVRAFGRRQFISASALEANEVVHNLSNRLGRVLGTDVVEPLDYAPVPLAFEGGHDGRSRLAFKPDPTRRGRATLLHEGTQVHPRAAVLDTSGYSRKSWDGS